MPSFQFTAFKSCQYFSTIQLRGIFFHRGIVVSELPWQRFLEYPRKLLLECFSSVYRRILPCFNYLNVTCTFSITFLVAASKSNRILRKPPVRGTEPGQASNVPATFFIDLICALPPTRDTEIPTLIAGRTPALNKFDSRNIWPSVIEITVGRDVCWYVTRLCFDDRNAVNEPPPFTKVSYRFRQIVHWSCDLVVLADLSGTL